MHEQHYADVARRAALSLVRINDEGESYLTVGFGEPLDARFLAAIREALSLPLPGGLTRERLAELRERHSGNVGVPELFAHVDHLERLLHDAESGALTAWSTSWREAFRKGAEAQKAACYRDAYDAAREFGVDDDVPPYVAAARVASAANATPIVSPDDDAKE